MALQEYTLNTGNVVSTCDLVVSPVLPWLGYSPDGVVFHNGEPALLLEVKSPVKRKEQKIVDLVKKKMIPYIISDGENFSLRPTHRNYSQLQLGLFLLGVDEAHFIVYSEVESLMIPVKKNVCFVDSVIKRLQFVHFRHYLPELTKYAK